MKRVNWWLLIGLILLLGSAVGLKTNLEKQRPLAAKSAVPVNLLGYIDYSENNLETAKQKGRPVLFFAATTWCQSCSALEEEIIARNQEIPADTTILKVDYDNDQEMNKKYGVTLQHTLVFLDENGQEITRSVGDDFDQLLGRLDKAS